MRTKEGWRAAGEKYGDEWVMIVGKTAEVVANAINAM